MIKHALFSVWILGLVGPVALWLWGPGDLLHPEVLRVVQFTVLLGALSAALSGAVGTVLANWAGRSKLSQSERVERAAWLAAMVPPVLIAPMVLALFRHTPWPYGVGAVLFAHAWLNIPWVFWQVFQQRVTLPDIHLDVASTLGVRGWRLFRDVEWPFVRGIAVSATLQSFVFCVSSFFLVTTLGGGPPVESLESLVYSAVRVGSASGPRWDIARACAWWQLGLGVVGWVVAERVRGPSGRPASPQRKHRRGAVGWSVGFLAPLLLISAVQWFQSMDGARHWIPVQVLLQSVGLGAFVALVTLIFAFGLKNLHGWQRLGLRASIALSPVVVAMAFDQVTYTWATHWPWLVTGCVHVALFLPFVCLSVEAFEAKRPRAAIDVLNVLGASPLRAWWWADGRRWSRVTGALGAAVFLFSALEATVTQIFATSTWRPFAVWVGDSLAHYQFETVTFWVSSLVLLGTVLWMLTLLPKRRALL